MVSTEDQNERREFQRHRVLKDGRIVTTAGTMIDCTIRDLSADGARVQVSSAIKLPNEFEFMVVKERILLHAQLIWRKGELAGLAFARS
jgi:PilZ domain